MKFLLLTIIAIVAVTALAESAQPTDVRNIPQKQGGLTCYMCKKLLPYVGNHECASKCSGWWSWAQSTCQGVCDALVKYLPAQDTCAAAGYCSLDLTGAVQVTGEQAVLSFMEGVAEGMVADLGDLSKCLSEGSDMINHFQTGVNSFYNGVEGKEASQVFQGIEDFGFGLIDLAQMWSDCGLKSAASDVKKIAGELQTPQGILKITFDEAIHIFSNRHEVTNDLVGIVNSWNQNDFQSAGMSAGKLIGFLLNNA